MEIAERFHRSVLPLYLSKRADISYGRGGQANVCRSGRYTNCVLDGGVWIDYQAGELCLENYRQTRLHRLPLPDLRQVTLDGLEDSDLWGIRRADGRVERLALNAAGLIVSAGFG